MLLKSRQTTNTAPSRLMKPRNSHRPNGTGKSYESSSALPPNKREIGFSLIISASQSSLGVNNHTSYISPITHSRPFRSPSLAPQTTCSLLIGAVNDTRECFGVASLFVCKRVPTADPRVGVCLHSSNSGLQNVDLAQ